MEALERRGKSLAIAAIIFIVFCLNCKSVEAVRNSTKMSYVCPPQFLRLGHSCYYFSDTKSTWQNALFACKDRDSNLSVPARWEDRNLRNFLNSNNDKASRWIGGVYDYGARSWKWGGELRRMQYQSFSKMKKLTPEELQWHCIAMMPELIYRFLATGSSFRSIGFNYRMGFSTVREIVQDVCDAIWKKMGPIYMPKPTTAMWEESENGFRNYWNFPNCCGALDGKHVNITCPINGGSNYWNYKGTNSIVLLALVDPKYRFLVIDVGSYGKNSDGGVLDNSVLGKLMQDGNIEFPAPKPLTLNSEPLPHVIVADEAFPLKPIVMRPYSKNDVRNNESNKIFNYRLSRARRIVENAFGILRSRWRVFAGPMAVQPNMVDKIILATCCLHNYLGTDDLPSDRDDDSLQANSTESTAFDHLKVHSHTSVTVKSPMTDR